MAARTAEDHCGRLVKLLGDGVNLAARISDVAPSGEVYVPASTAAALARRFRVEPVGALALAGIGVVELARVATAAPRDRNMMPRGSPGRPDPRRGAVRLLSPGRCVW